MAEQDDAVRKLRERLLYDTGPVQWSDLKAHAARQALFIVRRSLPLMDAAMSIALDDGPRIKAWLESGELYRPTAEQLNGWDSNPEGQFVSVVVQPYVLALDVQAEGAGFSPD